MTATGELSLLCPRCETPGAVHCAQTRCTWLSCDRCSLAMARLYGGRWDVIWDTLTGKQASLPKVTATHSLLEESFDVEDP